MQIRVEGLPNNAEPAIYDVKFKCVEGKDPDYTTVFEYIEPEQTQFQRKPYALVVGIPQGIRLISEDLHRVQYTHTTEDRDVYVYVESVSSPSDDYTRFINDILDLAPESYDGDMAAGLIAIQYVRDLEWIRDEAITALGRIAEDITVAPGREFANRIKQAILERARRTE